MNLKAHSNSKSGHRNISYDDSNRAYVVSVSRNNQRFVALLDTLKEAIDTRDSVIGFFEKNSRLPKKSEIGLTRRKYRIFKRRDKKIEQSCICKMCKKTMSYANLSEIKEFKERDNVCGNCQPKDRSELSLEIRPNKPNRLNEKYISITIKGTRTYYQCSIAKRRRSISRAFEFLNDAIVFRNQMLDFYKENDRLPDDSELESIFGIKLSNRQISNESKSSKNSATGLKNITYHSRQNCYYVTLARDRIKITLSFKTLEEAKLARKIILETYDETSVMLRPGEVRARMRELGKLK